MPQDLHDLQKENEALRQQVQKLEQNALLNAEEIADFRRSTEKANRELMNSRNFLTNILKNVMDPIFVKDKQHRWIDGNDALWDLFGKSKQELLGKSDYDFFPKEEADIFWQKDEEVFNSGIVNINVENFTDASGKLHIISTKKACFKGPEGDLILVGIIRDITEITQMQEKLKEINRETSSLLAAIVESSDDAIISRTLNGTITSWNKSAERLYGYSAEEAIGLHANVIVPPERWEEELRILRELSEGKHIQHFETVRRTKGGHTIDISLTISPIRDAAGNITGVSKVARDISERKKIEEQLKASLKEVSEAQKRAEIANQVKDDFLANMSHEIRTPLNSMIGLTELLLETELNPQQENMLSVVLQSGETLLEIINDLLDFSKIESGMLELESFPFDLQTAIEDTLDLFAPHAREKEQHLELLLYFVPGTPRYLIGDSVRIRQILSNLLNNALKFTQQGHILITVEEVKGDVPPENAKIKISIEDTGIGIAADKLQMIFDKFTQADISTTRKFGGTGLGLSICRQLAKLMQGDVNATSEPGKGSVFSTSLIFKRDTDASQALQQKTDYAILKGKKALIVEDSEPSRTIFTANLSNAGVKCTSLAHPDTAMQALAEAKISNTPFDVMVTDYMLPDMQSTAFTSQVKAVYPDMPIMMVTALAGKGYSQIFASSGCDAYITKPMRSSQFLDLLAMILKAKQEGKALSMLTPLSVFRKSAYHKGNNDNSFIEGAEILLAEDNRANRDLVIRILDNMGCHTTAVCDGEEAVAIVKKQYFDIILMDCQMPEMDGFEASKILRQMKKNGEIPDIPIIALTANAMQGDRERCLESGMSDYINKPLRKSALRNAFMQWLPPKNKRKNVSSKNSAA